VGCRFDFAIDEQHFSILADVKGPSEGELAACGHHAVLLRHFAFRVTEDGEIELQGRRKLLVRLGRVTTGSEVGDLELADLAPLSRSDLHSAVQPPVKALGNQATTTTFLPFRSDSL